MSYSISQGITKPSSLANEAPLVRVLPCASQAILPIQQVKGIDMAPCFNLAEGVVKISDESAFFLSVLKKALLIASQFA